MKGPRAPKFGSKYGMEAPKPTSTPKVGPAARGGASMNIKATGVTKSNVKVGSLTPKRGK